MDFKKNDITSYRKLSKVCLIGADWQLSVVVCRRNVSTWTPTSALGHHKPSHIQTLEIKPGQHWGEARVLPLSLLDSH